MALEIYRKKRRFDVTREPRGRKGSAPGGGDSFVVQKHAARRLHYDFRLELDGVLKSWAVTRGPSLVPGEKRLAVETEDHPLSYGGFEGTIPAGQYGGGTVMVWDRGRWIPDGDPHAGLQKGHLQFTLKGEKLTGRWHLVRMHRRLGEKRDNWLLIKGADEAARTASDPDPLDEQTLSVATRRSLDEIAAGKTPKRKSTVKAAAVWASSRSASAPVPKKTSSSASRSPRRSRRDGERGASQKEQKEKHRDGPAAAPRRNSRKPAGRGAKASGRRSESPTAHPPARPSSRPPKGPIGSLPSFVEPCLATLAAEPPAGPGWIHEIKFDGYRIQAGLAAGAVALRTRKNLDWADRFPNVAAALAALPARSALFDGEVVDEGDRGVSDFSALQAVLKEGGEHRFIYYAFDLLHVDGRDLRDMPLGERKSRLARLLDGLAADGPVRFSAHFDQPGEVVRQHACGLGLEGIVSKRSDAPYRSGRGLDWIKSKCSNRQEFVVGGFSPASTSRRAIGALAVGYYEGDTLRYAGRIGTGYNRDTAADLFRRLQPRRIARMAFNALPDDERRKDMMWVKPETVIEAEVRGWTGSGLLRHAAFKGLREDKPPREVLREAPASSPGAVGSAASVRHRAKAKRRIGTTRDPEPKARHKPEKADGTGSRERVPQNPDGASADIVSGKLTNPQRVYWQDVDITKQGLADFYASVWDWMGPHIVRRPLALLRCPNGVGSECFVQKHAHATFDLTRIISYDDHGEELIAIDSLDGLLALVQAGALEVHVWGTTLDHVDLCDRMVFDLDPGLGVGWPAVVAAAREVRERLLAMGLESFLKTSGGKGLHIVVPFDGADWDTTKAFAKRVAYEMSADSPDKYLPKMSKNSRPGKIFVDYLRNGRGATTVAPYSPRARPGAPVSTPVAWTELTTRLSPGRWTLLNLEKRLRRLPQDPWAAIGTVRQTLPGIRKR